MSICQRVSTLEYTLHNITPQAILISHLSLHLKSYFSKFLYQGGYVFAVICLITQKAESKFNDIS